MFESEFPGMRSCPLYGLHLERCVDWGLDHLPEGLGVDSTIGDVHWFANDCVRYTIDPENIWQASHLTLNLKAGDCEDYCFLKYDLLRLLGYPASSMAIVFGNLGIRRYWRWTSERHAMLFVKHEGQILVLDNRQRLVKIPAFYEGNFQPYQWVNEKGGGIYLPAAK